MKELTLTSLLQEKIGSYTNFNTDIATVSQSQEMNLSFEFTFLDLLSQFHTSPLLHQKPQHAYIDYSR
jgi:hypothetical protein